MISCELVFGARGRGREKRFWKVWNDCSDRPSLDGVVQAFDNQAQRERRAEHYYWAPLLCSTIPYHLVAWHLSTLWYVSACVHTNSRTRTRYCTLNGNLELVGKFFLGQMWASNPGNFGRRWMRWRVGWIALKMIEATYRLIVLCSPWFLRNDNN